MKRIALGIALVAIFLSIAIFLPVDSQPQPAGAAQPFDHSNCQYPDRWSNPANGCDNSDPAVPECIGEWSTEAQEKACIDAFVEANKGTAEKREAIKEHSEPFKTAQPEAAQCGGK